MNKWYNSPVGVLIGIALILLVMLGSCTAMVYSCSAHGGSFSGTSGDCTMPEDVPK